MKQIWTVLYYQENMGQCIMGAYECEKDARAYIAENPVSATNGESYGLHETYLMATNKRPTTQRHLGEPEK
jgi:hypothetical protein